MVNVSSTSTMVASEIDLVVVLHFDVIIGL